MVDQTVGAFQRQRQTFSLELLACLVGTAILVATATTVAIRPALLSTNHSLSLFLVGCLIPVIGAWRQAIRDERLPPITKTKIKHEHITGWGFIAIALSVSLILGLASWATSNSLANRDIHAQWGVYVVFGLAIVFALAALSPPISLRKTARSGDVVGAISAVIRPFGLLLSAIDSLLVFAIAGGAGVRQHWTWLRYILLFGTLIPCGILGYTLPAPHGLAPLAWGLLVAVSISRRWAWVEDDRDVYMLNREFGSQLRVGFDQDLRDEALLSFMSMFFLVPLALAQAQAWSEQLQQPLFKISLDHDPNLIDWIGFFGTELAKAAPFVDWAEVYQVHGDDNFETASHAGEHVVFGMRVVVDLVFLAALVQALSIAARNAKQMEMFNAKTLNRLDPFTEPRVFRTLLRRGKKRDWEVDEDALAKFRTGYDAIRLAQLSDPAFAPINLAAIALRRRDGSDDAARFMQQLRDRAFQKPKDPTSIDEAINAIRVSGLIVPAAELDQVRIELNHRAGLNAARETLVRLIARCPDSAERFQALESVLIGKSPYSDGEPPEQIADSIYTVRRVAVEALRPQVKAGDAAAIRLLDQVTRSDASSRVRKRANEILGRLADPSSNSEPA